MSVSREDRIKNKTTNTYTREEMFEWFNLAFDTNQGSREWRENKEKFTLFLEDPIDIKFSYFHYQHPYRLREIYLCTWAGGWGTQMRSLHIELNWDYDYYRFSRNFHQHTPSATIEKERITKEEVLEELLEYFKLVTPELVKPLIRHQKLNQLV